MAVEGGCSHCGGKATLTCAGCKNSKFCSVECQEADWHAHKYLCKNFADFTTPPNPRMRRAILLPESSKEPRFIWLSAETIGGDKDEVGSEEEEGSGSEEDDDCDSHGDDEGGSLDGEDEVTEEYSMPEIKKILSDADRYLVQYVSLPFADRQKEGDVVNTIIVACGEEFMMDGSLRNQSLAHLLRDKPDLSGTWLGPVIFCGFKDVSMSYLCRDLDCNDLTIALAGAVDLQDRYRLRFLYTARPELRYPNYGDRIMGVKVSVSSPTFEQVDIPFDHPVFFANKLRRHSEKLGTDILVYQQRATPVKIQPGAQHRAKPAGALLTKDASSSSGTAGMSPPDDSASKCGNKLVVRSDKGPISVDEVEELCKSSLFGA